MCSQSVGLVQRALEEHGVSTVGYTLLRLMTERVKAPRALWVEAPFGRTFGEPGDRQRQRALLLEALEVLEEAREPGSILRSALPPHRL